MPGVSRYEKLRLVSQSELELSATELLRALIEVIELRLEAANADIPDLYLQLQRASALARYTETNVNAKLLLTSIISEL